MVAHGAALQDASDQLADDTEVVLAAVRNDGLALEFAGEIVQANREVAMAAVCQNALAVQFVAEALREDREVLTAAAQACVVDVGAGVVGEHLIAGRTAAWKSMNMNSSGGFSVSSGGGNDGKRLRTLAGPKLQADDEFWRSLTLKARAQPFSNLLPPSAWPLLLPPSTPSPAFSRLLSPSLTFSHPLPPSIAQAREAATDAWKATLPTAPNQNAAANTATADAAHAGGAASKEGDAAAELPKLVACTQDEKERERLEVEALFERFVAKQLEPTPPSTARGGLAPYCLPPPTSCFPPAVSCCLLLLTSCCVLLTSLLPTPHSLVPPPPLRRGRQGQQHAHRG